LFEERKTKFALLSLLSAVLVTSIAFAGISIYAQTADDSDLTTFEEEAMAGEESANDNGDSTSIAADVSSLLDGLQICNVGTSEISGETEVAAMPDEDAPATVSVEMMTRAEVDDLASSETGTASDDGTPAASAECVLTGGSDNNNADALTSDGSNGTAIASAPDSDQEILVIDGQGFVPGQVVLIFTEDALVGIDDVDTDGNIGAKIPVPDSGSTTIAADGNDSGSIELRFLESGTERTTTFEFDGQTLTAQAGRDIEAEGSEDNS
jgi:hypothetical protein